MPMKWLSPLPVFLTVLLVLFAGTACVPDPVIDEDPDVDVIDMEEEPEVEAVVEETETEEQFPASTYFWPWVSHGQLVLSSGEVIIGPNLFESDLGFIAEFTRDHSYSGELYWLVEKSDVFELEWATLTFDVEYYEQGEWEYDIDFVFDIDDLQPRASAEGVQEFDLDLVEEQDGFKVTISRVRLGKNRESSFGEEPIDYVALDIEMKAVEKP